MTERKRLECRNFGNCLWNGEHNYGCDGHLPEWDGERHDCEEYEPMPDVKSLLELADEIEEHIAQWSGIEDGDASDIVFRIREAVGA